MSVELSCLSSSMLPFSTSSNVKNEGLNQLNASKSNSCIVPRVYETAKLGLRTYR